MPRPFCTLNKRGFLFVFLLSLFGNIEYAKAKANDTLQPINTATEQSDTGALSPLSIEEENKCIVIEGDVNFPPFESINDKGELEGFNVDLIHAIMKNLNLNYTFQLRNWSDAVAGFDAKRVDVLSGMAHTKDDVGGNKRFGIPYQKLKFALITREDEKLSRIEALRSRKVIVADKSSSHQFLIDNGLEASLVLSDGNLESDVDLLLKRKCDAILTVDLVAYHFISKNHMQQMLNVCPVENTEVQGFSFVVHNDGEELLYLLNKSLSELKATGVYDQIYDKWFGVYEQKEGMSKKVYLVLSIVLIAFLIAVVFVYITRRQIDRATRRIRTLNREMKLLLRAGNMTAWVYHIKQGKFSSLYETAFIGKGLTLDEYCEWLHEQDRATFKEMIDKIISKRSKETGGVIRSRDTKNRKDYNAYELEMILAKDEKGEQCVVGTLREFTEEHARANTIERLYQENKIILKALPVGVVIYDKHGYQQYINEAVAQIFGIPDIDAHLKKRLCFYDDPEMPELIKEKVRCAKEVNEAIEYDVDKVVEAGYFDTNISHKIYLDIKMRYLKDKFGEVDKIIVIVNDVTESRIHELKLERSELNLKLALQAGGVRVGYYDVKSGLFNGIYGTFRNESSTMEQFKQLLTEDYLPEFEQMYNDVLSGKTTRATSVMRLNSDDDQIAYVENRIIVMPSESGEIETIIGTYKDVTNIYQYQKELETSKSKIEAAIYNSDLILWDYDCITQRCYTMTDAVIKGTTELTIEECMKITHPEDQQVLRNSFELMYRRDNEKYAIDIRIKLAASNDWQYVTINASPLLHDSSDRPSRYLGVIRNNTKWIQLNNELQKLNEQNMLVMNNCNSGFVYLTPDYTVRWENISFNQVNCRDSDWYVVGETCYKRLGKETPCENCPAKRALESRAVVVAQMRRENGSVYEVFAMPVLTKGEVEGVVLRIDNITERTHTYDELCRAKEKAERSDKLKSAFLANMSHEIRTPLNAIVGFTELLMTAEAEEERQQYLQIVNMNNDLLLKLINDILDLSKIEAGFVELNPMLFDLSEYFDSLAVLFEQRITTDSVKLICENPYSVCQIEFDKDRLSQLITNFVINAIKFTVEGQIVMRYEVENDGIRIEVSDTGIGIAADKIEKVFERFEKLDNFAQGTGLGMAICKAIVDACGGEIGADSTVGKGTTFRVWLPCVVVAVETTNRE